MKRPRPRGMQKKGIIMSAKNPPKKQMSDGTKALIICLAAVALMIAAIVTVIIVTNLPEAPAAGEVNMTAVQAEINSKTVYDFEETDQVTEYVKISVKDMGDIVIRLRPDVAPITVANFQKLVKEGFYTDLLFHRVMKDFMIQGGSGESQNRTASTIKGEFSYNGVENNLLHIRGVISMARVPGQKDSASSQFFICNATNSSVTQLDGQYATFGYVVAGMSTVDAITAVPCTGSAQSPRPITDVVIQKAVFVNPI